jgi:transcriptional regulator with XRE-family HTH domain
MPRSTPSSDVRIRLLRENRKASREQVAVDLGVSLDTIRRWEIEGPPRHRVEDVADYFDVSPAYLMGWAKRAA